MNFMWKAIEGVLADRWAKAAVVLTELNQGLTAVLGCGQQAADSLSKQFRKMATASGGSAVTDPPTLSRRSTFMAKVVAHFKPEDSSSSSATPCAEDVQASVKGGRPDPHTFVPREQVEVWSESEGRWLQGVVDRVFATASEDNGYAVPAGVVRVTHPGGVKYVRKEQQASQLRRF